ncbi:MAG: zinc ABC transporter substrate-binding protein [Candidatus Dormiibacterota bacterium]
MRFAASGVAARLGIGGIGLLTATATLAAMAPAAQASSAKIVAVGAENEYANVIGQIGGSYVSVSAIESNPNTDPHTFEVSPAVAEVVSKASLIVQNGVGYDAYMNHIEAASPNSNRKVIVVQSLLGLPDSTRNPHLWYKPHTMSAVANAVANDLAHLDPAHASYFRVRATAFDRSLQSWYRDIANVKKAFPHVAVAVTEPVGDYMLNAVGANILTPWSLQADVMNGVDPSPQDVATEQNLFSQHRVKVFLYNQQVTDSLTVSFLSLARRYHIPVVGVYETMPTPGYDYQSWMLAEVNALKAALQHQKSTVSLLSH